MCLESYFEPGQPGDAPGDGRWLTQAGPRPSGLSPSQAPQSWQQCSLREPGSTPASDSSRVILRKPLVLLRPYRPKGRLGLFPSGILTGPLKLWKQMCWRDSEGVDKQQTSTQPVQLKIPEVARTSRAVPRTPISLLASSRAPSVHLLSVAKLHFWAI